jgi:tetratricopeptide (TPR) repeat protein
MRRIGWLVLGLSVLGAMSAGAQSGKVKEPKRPKLGAGADTNDAKAYYDWGVAQLDTRADDAADALYWATRINPGWAEAFYARWVATHMSDKYRFRMYMEGDRDTRRSPEIRRIDSLYLKALTLNPFLYRKFERTMLYTFLMLANHQNGGSDAELDEMVRRALTSAHNSPRNAYIQGNFVRSLEAWANQLPTVKDKDKSYIHAERGRIFEMIGAYDSATAELQLAVKQWRNDDKDSIVVVYESKALYEHSVGMIQEKQARLDSARESYGRALEEDLAFAPAHMRLSAIDLAKGDTAGALSEMDIAAQVQPGDGLMAFQYGFALIQAGHDPEAMEQLKRAVALEPYYSAPRLLIALIYDAADMKEEATVEYKGFLTVASQGDPQRPRAMQRVAALSAPSTTSAPAPPKR